MITFEIIPVLSFMEELYSQPVTPARFQEYITQLQGSTKGDLAIPIMGFNPMAKTHLLEKVRTLISLKAEAIAKEHLNEWSENFPSSKDIHLKVALNVADDLKGAWTNFYTTDFDSKFKINALVQRHFCAPHFWASEVYDPPMIRQRILQYALRTIYWIEHPRLQTLEDHLSQEQFVWHNIPNVSAPYKEIPYSFLKNFYTTHKGSDDYSLIFNFFYGDQASASLNYPCFGITEMNGFEFAKILANQ